MQYKNILKKFNNKIIILTFALMLALTGCGKDSGEASAPAVEPIPSQSSPEANADEPTDNSELDGTDQDMDDSAENGPSSEKQGSDEQSNDTGNSSSSNSYASQSDTELDGNIRTIGTDSFVVSQNFTMPTEDSDAGEIIVSPAEGSEDEVLITVHVTENTIYQIRTVKNGGVNGDSDVEKTEGSFSDLQEKNSVNAYGHYENNDFWADEIIIYRFV